MQNNLEDLYSLLCFLHVEPWCNWAWYEVNVKGVNYILALHKLPETAMCSTQQSLCQTFCKLFRISKLRWIYDTLPFPNLTLLGGTS